VAGFDAARAESGGNVHELGAGMHDLRLSDHRLEAEQSRRAHRPRSAPKRSSMTV
jgi:hypothetical protein